MSIAKEIAKEYAEHFEQWEEEARREREKSVDWKKVAKTCTPKQVEAIKLFVKYRLYEAAASIAEMDLYDFIRLLEKLGIARG
ncbi:MAG: hypothetical protein QMD00_06205 [Hadesarchaea archaeon]|nr:hypothetical protein [Hadesarchaea archaeon]